MRLACLLLAAGAGTRFGATKQLVRIEGKPMVQRQLEALAPLFGRDLYAVVGADRDKVRPLVEDLAQAVENPDWQRGIGSSIARGVIAAAAVQHYDGIMIALADQVHLGTQDFRRLIDCYDGRRIAAASYAGTPGVPAIFPPALFPQLQRLDGDTGAKSILLDNSLDRVTLPLDAAARDVDIPADLPVTQPTENCPNSR